MIGTGSLARAEVPAADGRQEARSSEQGTVERRVAGASSGPGCSRAAEEADRADGQTHQWLNETAVCAFVRVGPEPPMDRRGNDSDWKSESLGSPCGAGEQPGMTER